MALPCTTYCNELHHNVSPLINPDRTTIVMDMQLLAGAMVSLVWIGLLVSHIVDTRSRQDAERLILQPPVADSRSSGTRR